VGKEEVKDWWFSYTIHTNPPPEPVPQLYSVPSELFPELLSDHELSFYELFPIPSELEPDPERLFSDFRYKPDFSETFCSVGLWFGYLAWALSALGDFLEVEMVESQFSQS